MYDARGSAPSERQSTSTGTPVDAAILSTAGGDLDKFLEDRAGRVARLTAFLRSLAREGDPDLAGLTLAVRQLRSIVD